MLKIRKWETSDVMGLKLLGRAYITILENKESVFCLRKWAIVITMAIEIDHSNNLHKMCSSFIFGSFREPSDLQDSQLDWISQGQNPYLIHFGFPSA